MYARVIWEEWGETAYKQQATGGGETFRESKNMRVSFIKGGVTVAESYLKTHMVKIHDICFPQTRNFDEVSVGLTTYVVSFSRVLQ